MSQSRELERNRRILIVDDNPAIHEDFRKILGTSGAREQLDSLEAELFGVADAQPAAVGYELTSAYQGQEALAEVRRAVAAGQPHALAFVDVRMPPGWDGIETVERMWREQPDLEVVICTAYSDYAWDEIVARLPRDDQLIILKKPFDNIEVLQLAQALTEKWSLRRQADREKQALEAEVADLKEIIGAYRKAGAGT